MPQFAGLTTLLLKDNFLEREGITALASSPHLRNVTTFELERGGSRSRDRARGGCRSCET